jgi:hypothetical protein
MYQISVSIILARIVATDAHHTSKCGNSLPIIQSEPGGQRLLTHLTSICVRMGAASRLTLFVKVTDGW